MKHDRKYIKYAEADKYVLAEDYFDLAPFKPSWPIYTSYGYFLTSGEYKIARGFLFSANFPAINTEDSRRAAAQHDFFYQLIKDGLLHRKHRYDADYLMYNTLLEDGMIDFRAWYWFRAVRAGGDSALDSSGPKVRTAPPEPKQPAGWQAKEILGG